MEITLRLNINKGDYFRLSPQEKAAYLVKDINSSNPVDAAWTKDLIIAELRINANSEGWSDAYNKKHPKEYDAYITDKTNENLEWLKNKGVDEHKRIDWLREVIRKYEADMVDVKRSESESGSVATPRKKLFGLFGGRRSRRKSKSSRGTRKNKRRNKR
jgi:hypothetical protein